MPELPLPLREASLQLWHSIRKVRVRGVYKNHSGHFRRISPRVNTNIKATHRMADEYERRRDFFNLSPKWP